MLQTYRGTVSGFIPRTESPVIRKRTTLVWNFRLERRSPDGQPLPRIAVEMRGKFYQGGSINNGDVVELTGAQDSRGLVVVSDVNNLTAGTRIRARKYNASLVVGGIIKWIIVVLVAIAMIVVAMVLIHNMSIQ